MMSQNWKKLCKKMKPRKPAVAKDLEITDISVLVENIEEVSSNVLTDTKNRDLLILDLVEKNKKNHLSDIQSVEQGENSNELERGNNVRKDGQDYNTKKLLDGKKNLLEPESTNPLHSNQNNSEKVGKYLAIDCEMVGVGPEGSISTLARVSITNFHGKTVMDEFIMPLEKITDYRTHVSGITPQLLRENGKPFKSVQQKVCQLIKDKILIGHGLKNDFNVLLISHPSRLCRDTSLYKPLRTKLGRANKLKSLAANIGIDIQGGEHSSVDDARAAMMVFRTHKTEWDQSVFKMMLRKQKNVDRLVGKEQRQLEAILGAKAKIKCDEDDN